MAKYTYEKKGGTIGTATLDRPRGVLVAQMDIEEAVAKATAAGNTITSGDLLTVITIPARSKLIVHAVVNETAIAIGGTPVIELGDLSDDDNIVANQTTVTAGSFATIEAVGLAGLTYTSANELNLKLSNGSGAITSGTIAIYYELIDLSARSDGTPVF